MGIVVCFGGISRSFRCPLVLDAIVRLLRQEALVTPQFLEAHLIRTKSTTPVLPKPAR